MKTQASQGNSASNSLEQSKRNEDERKISESGDGISKVSERSGAGSKMLKSPSQNKFNQKRFSMQPIIQNSVDKGPLRRMSLQPAGNSEGNISNLDIQNTNIPLNELIKPALSPRFGLSDVDVSKKMTQSLESSTSENLGDPISSKNRVLTPSCPNQRSSFKANTSETNEISSLRVASAGWDRLRNNQKVTGIVKYAQ